MNSEPAALLDIVRRIERRLKDGQARSGAGEPRSKGAEEPGSRGAPERGNRGAGELRSGGTGERASIRAEEQVSGGEGELRSRGAGERSRKHSGQNGAPARQRERGFTLPELLITTFLIASATGLISTAIYQIFIVSADGNARLSALNDLENSAIWIGRDASEAQSWANGSGTIYGTLTTSDPSVQYRYSYDAANTALIREHLVAGVPQTTTRIARNIDNQGDVIFGASGTLLTVSLTSTVGPTSESASLKLGMRVK